MPSTFLSFGRIFMGALLLTGCLDNTPIPGGGPESFVAMQADFADFRTWTSTAISSEDATETGHLAGERVVYLSAEPDPDDTAFPVGTMLVKTIETEAGTDVHAMAKRGDGFNPEGGGWEWFELVPDSAGTPVILWRGAVPPAGEQYGALPGQTADTSAPPGDCNGCHGAVAANDFVHTFALGGR